jgi:hypothetical protein
VFTSRFHVRQELGPRQFQLDHPQTRYINHSVHKIMVASRYRTWVGKTKISRYIIKLGEPGAIIGFDIETSQFEVGPVELDQVMKYRSPQFKRCLREEPRIRFPMTRGCASSHRNPSRILLTSVTVGTTTPQGNLAPKI